MANSAQLCKDRGCGAPPLYSGAEQHCLRIFKLNKKIHERPEVTQHEHNISFPSEGTEVMSVARDIPFQEGLSMLRTALVDAMGNV